MISKDLPLESNDIIGKSWGYVTNDTVNRSTKELIHLLVKSAGLGANLLLNIGPTPEGEVRPAHRQRLLEMGNWMNTYGETIYGTRKSWMKPADWGVAVEKNNTVYLHILYPDKLKNHLDLKNFPYKIEKATWFGTGQNVLFTVSKNTGDINLQLPGLKTDDIDQVIILYTTNK